ncbi:MAG: HAMP domain-containing protein [Candidatus Electronema aureum]|uniref:HAMP domain-containing protein n=1 Tax=Candidatus Electronema aureum TaxID=2005002 RepID=A0A521G3I5_9BACT|nr:MAG: HAMP domain-containing protein [Candidatus Electronema aureum]
MSTSPQEANGMSLKNKALSFFALTVLLTLFTAVFVMRGGPPVAALAALGLLLCVLAAALLSFQIYVLKPLADVHAVTRQMIDGHLDRLNRIHRADEIGRLGESINDLAVNMQEVLLFVWNHGQESRELLERIAALSDAEPQSELDEDIEQMRQSNENLKDIVTSFSYFEIRLEHERMMAESDCGKDGTCCGGGAACKYPTA